MKRPLFDVELVEHPVEQPANQIEQQATVFFFWEKNIVIWLPIATRQLVGMQALVHAFGSRQTHCGGLVALDLGQIEPQVFEAAIDHLDVPVFDLPNVSGTHKGVDHELDQPEHFGGHLVKTALDPNFFVWFPIGEGFVTQIFEFFQNRFVFGDGEGTP